MKSPLQYYNKFLFPRLMQWNLANPEIDEQRRTLLSLAKGKVLEIGYGTGLNTPFYPNTIEKLTAIDINPAMEGFINKKLKSRSLSIELYNMSAEDMMFTAETFDFVISTFTFCSIPRIDQALAEIYRVLKPGGHLLFLEHGISPDPWVRKLQLWTNPLFNLFAGGCNVNRDIEEIVINSGLTIIELQKFYMGRPISGYSYKGIARKP